MEISEQGESPFPLVVIENAFTPEMVRAAEAEWPATNWPWWHVYGDGNANKLASKDPSRITPASARLLDRMANLEVDSVFKQTGLFPDFTMHGAGMHAIGNGGFLKAHLDSDHHPTMGWSREVSGVLFLNEHWEPSWGGELQLLNPEGKEVIKCLSPKFNRLVLFRCRGTAWHQVSPVTCPETESRKTLAMFWWSKKSSPGTRPTALFKSTVECAAETHS